MNDRLRGTAQLIDRESLSRRVLLWRQVEHRWSLMKSADGAASVFGGNPNVVLEALACGCPLVRS